jgi:hypothetical protein
MQILIFLILNSFHIQLINIQNVPLPLHSIQLCFKNINPTLTYKSTTTNTDNKQVFMLDNKQVFMLDNKQVFMQILVQ